jgi:hypothetical protein
MVKSPQTRFSHLPTVLVRAAILAAPLVLLVTVGAFFFRSSSKSAGTSQFSSSPATWQESQSQSAEVAAPQLVTRPVFPYSIVPGGVRDAKELRSAADSDPVVAEHYSGFRIARAHSVQLRQPLLMYVSYRRDNRVYWTRKPMTIPAGETLLTDGENFARTRCANRLSPVAAKPLAATEPASEQLNEPTFIPPLLANLLPGEEIGFFPGTGAQLVPPSGTPQGVAPPPPGSQTPPVLPPILFPGGPPISPNTPVPPPPPVNTPEPGTFALLLAGIATAVLTFVLRRRWA